MYVRYTAGIFWAILALFCIAGASENGKWYWFVGLAICFLAGFASAPIEDKQEKLEKKSRE